MTAKKLMSSLLIAGACFTTVGFSGCAETSSTTETKTTTTPGGTTEEKTKTEVKKTGDNPPPANH